MFSRLREWAEAQDAADPLAGVREQFHLPRTENGADAVYCCGHSLGPQPRTAAGYLRQALDIWGERGVEGHHDGDPSWGDYAAPLAAMSAHLAGAQPADVAIFPALTVALHQMLASFYRPVRERPCILIESPAFPSDRYAVASQIRWHGFDPATAMIEVAPRPGEPTLRQEDLLARIEQEGPRLALVLLGGVNYYTGQAFDLAGVAKAARSAGALVGFDLAHAMGAVAIDLRSANPDFAVWCGYKYLCGGPGAPAAAFVHPRHHQTRGPRLEGWWGNRADTRFEMRHDFEPEAGAAAWVVSCPSILAMAGLRAGLEIFAKISLDARQAKAQAFAAGFDRWAAERIPQVQRITPAAASERGAQCSLDFGAEAGSVQRQLRAAGIFSDVRGPILRVSFHPFYNRFADVAAVVAELARMPS